MANPANTACSAVFTPAATLVAGIIATAVLALSVHTFMMDVLHIPYPDHYPESGGWLLFNQTLRVLAILCCYRLAQDNLARLPVLPGKPAFVILLAMLDQDLIRGPVMQAVVTSAWGFALVDNLNKLGPTLLLAGLAALIAPRLTRAWHYLLAALTIAWLVQCVCGPIIQDHVHQILGKMTPPRPEDIIYPPYGLNIKIPAYLTFVEPAIASVVLFALIRDRLTSVPLRQAGQFTLLLLFMTGLAFAPFINLFYADLPALTAMLSVGQFSLQTVALALLAVMTWRRYTTRKRQAPSASD